MLVDGKEMGFPGTCYLPFIRHDLGNMDDSLKYYWRTWVIGIRILKDHYMIYDMVDGFNNGYNRLGIAPKNPKDTIGSDYNPDNNSFLSEYLDAIIAVMISLVVCVCCLCFFLWRKRK